MAQICGHAGKGEGVHRCLRGGWPDTRLLARVHGLALPSRPGICTQCRHSLPRSRQVEERQPEARRVPAAWERRDGGGKDGASSQPPGPAQPFADVRSREEQAHGP